MEFRPALANYMPEYLIYLDFLEKLQPYDPLEEKSHAVKAVTKLCEMTVSEMRTINCQVKTYGIILEFTNDTLTDSIERWREYNTFYSSIAPLKPISRNLFEEAVSKTFFLGFNEGAKSILQIYLSEKKNENEDNKIKFALLKQFYAIATEKLESYKNAVKNTKIEGKTPKTEVENLREALEKAKKFERWAKKEFKKAGIIIMPKA